MSILLLFLGIIIGFLFWKIFAGKYEGDRLERSLRFLIKNYYIHLHHWLWSVILLVILFSLHIKIPFLYGILIGSIIQGLTYKDWYVIVYHKDR
ncbi:MAG: hypothetical protein GYA31_01575 [Parcubacteria group bacterium]|nr:hypothetical protein [Parcubacteria group bacterium]